jgi:hypothetical protein
VYIYIYTAFISQEGCFACWIILTWLWWCLPEVNQKIAHNLCKLQCHQCRWFERKFCAICGGQREKLWQEFFSDPLQWWDHRSKKASEHQSYQSSHVNRAIAPVGVNLVAL